MVCNLRIRILASLLWLISVDLMAGNPASIKYVQQSEGSSSPSPQAYTIGQYAQGGVIFWLTPDGQHGLVASIVDMPTDPVSLGGGLQWSPNGQIDPIGASGDDLAFGLNYTTTGKINTGLIVEFYTANPVSNPQYYAAGACASYSVTVDGVTYDDWYLPSIAELGVIQSMKATIDRVSIAQGGTAIQVVDYWSSVESNTGGSVEWYWSFSNNYYDLARASLYKQARAVRAF